MKSQGIPTLQTKSHHDVPVQSDAPVGKFARAVCAKKSEHY